MLANIFLHEVLDVWFAREVLPRLRGRAHLVRYADDAVMLFEHEEDARRVMSVLPHRMGKHGLTLHPEKTRLIAFGRPGKGKRAGVDGPDKPGTFDFLGFTHYWGKSLRGNWCMMTRTASDRFRRSLRRIYEWCKGHFHEPLGTQQQALNAKLRGHYGYFGRVGNSSRLWALLYWARRAWQHSLSRRSQRGLSWVAMSRLLQAYPLLEPRLRPA